MRVTVGPETITIGPLEDSSCAMFDPRIDIGTCCHMAAIAAFPRLIDRDSRDKFAAALERVAEAVAATIEHRTRENQLRMFR